MIVAEELASGALIRPFGPDLDSGGYYVVYRARDQANERVMKVRRWLTREARALARGAKLSAATGS